MFYDDYDILLFTGNFIYCPTNDFSGNTIDSVQFNDIKYHGSFTLTKIVILLSKINLCGINYFHY